MAVSRTWKPPTTKDFCRAAAAAVKRYVEITGGKGNGLQSNVQDVIADIRHLCWKHKIEWDAVMSMSEAHYAEQSGLHWKYPGAVGDEMPHCDACGDRTPYVTKKGCPICIKCFEGMKRGNKVNRR